MDKLETLDISNTDIDSGLEYLPNSIKMFDCSVNQRPEAKVKKIADELERYRRFFDIRTANNYVTLLQRWKENKQKLIYEQLKEQLGNIENEKEKLIKRIATLEELSKESKRLIKQQKQKVVDNHYHFFTEEEKYALQELIKVHRTYEEAKKIKKETDGLYERYHFLRKKLKDKLGKEFIEVVQSVLTDLEELYQREWDLQRQLEEKEKTLTTKRLIEEITERNKQALLSLTVNVQGNLLLENVNVEKGHALIGNSIGDNANLSYSNYHTRVEEEVLEAKIEVLPKI